MTAFGFVFVLLGVALISLFIRPHTTEFSLAEILSGFVFAIGAFLFLGGITIWLWRVMP